MLLQNIPLGARASLGHLRTDRFKTAMLAVSLTLPATVERSVANQLLSGVLRRGTVCYPSSALLNRRLDELYAAGVEIKGAKHGKNESLMLVAELLDTRYVTEGENPTDGVAQVISQMLFSPLTEQNGDLLSDSVEKEKNNVCDAIRAVIHNPRAYASMRCAEIMCEGEADCATMEQLLACVERADAHTLRQAYDSLLQNAHWSFFYVGSADAPQIEALIRRHFAPALCGSALPLTPLCAKSEIRGARVDERMAVSQGKLAIGLRTGVDISHPDRYAMVLANEILGGSPASKLFLNVRERLGLCYYCSSAYNLYSGNILIGAGIDVSDRALAEEQILSQLSAMQQGQISEVELHAARKSIANAYRQIYDNPFDLHAFYHGRALFDMTESIEECREALMQVSAEQIIAAAQRIQVDTVYFLEGSESAEEEETDE